MTATTMDTANDTAGSLFGSFKISDGESWCIYGRNNSGISEFIKLFTQNPEKSHAARQQTKTAVISFAKQQEIFEEEVKNDQTDFLGHIDPGTPARQFIHNPEQHQDLIDAFNLMHCMDKGYRQLSSGESRKLLLLSSVSNTPDLLIIENPYDGLDTGSCEELDILLNYLSRRDYKILITVNNDEDIPDWCTHLAIIERGHISLQGQRRDILKKYQTKDQSTHSLALEKAKVTRRDAATTPLELIHLKNGYASYGSTTIFKGLDLKVNQGQHTLLTGPNGSGKSTLLQIITGDNQNCYGNDLYIFGIRRGSGESIWELKRQMGIISPDLHRNYYIPGSALQVVLSGFFDSIGVYREFSSIQKERAMHWLKITGLQEMARKSFRQLSYADQRLCLIARALIKMPPLLILDEPTQGLDKQNRDSLLNFLEHIAANKLSTILYASHRQDEFRNFFTQHVELSNY